MINYRVDNLTRCSRSSGPEALRSSAAPNRTKNGKFAWIMDPDGNKVELWEPLIWDDKNKSG